MNHICYIDYNRFEFDDSNQNNQNQNNPNQNQWNLYNNDNNGNESIIDFDKYYQENQKRFDDLGSINSILRKNDSNSSDQQSVNYPSNYSSNHSSNYLNSTNLKIFNKKKQNELHTKPTKYTKFEFG